MALYSLPLSPEPQSFNTQLGASSYNLTLEWSTANNTWVLHISDTNDNRLLSSLPLVAGTDLLEPYGYLNFGGSLYAVTDGDLLTPPTFENLGTLGLVIFETP